MARQLDHDRLMSAMAARRHGVLSRAVLLDAGIAAGTIDGRLRQRRLVSLYRGVYGLGHAQLSDAGWRLAAVDAYGPTAAVSHVSAAALWGLLDAPLFPVHVSVAKRDGIAERRRTVLHRPTELRDAEVVVRGAIRVTTVARTIFDVAASIRGRRLEQVVRRASRLRLFDLREQQLVLERHSRRPGASELGRLLSALQGRGTDDLRSPMEIAFAQLCEDYGLRRPVANGLVLGERVDFHWPGTTLIVETDSFEFHAMPTTFANDRRRDQKLTLAGFTVLRLTWDQVTGDARATAAIVSTLLTQCRPS
jgi:very-short-patch-repair endonuclease